MKSAFTFMKFSIKNKMKAGWYKLLSYVSFGKLKRRFTKKFYKFKELSIQPHIEIVQKQHEDKVIIKIVQKFIYNLEDDIKNIQQDCCTHNLNSHCHDNLEKIQQKLTEFNVLLQEKKISTTPLFLSMSSNQNDKKTSLSLFSPSKEKICPLCHATALKVFEEKIFTKYKAEYFFCENCQFLHVDSPTWLDEAYQEPINKEDTGILIRNETIRNNLSIVLHALFDSNAKFLDFAGGYGFLTRMMRDVGFDFYWYDEYTMNLTAQGFEGDLTQQYDAVTAFEIFEHLETPINELEKLLSITNTIIFSTEILPSTIPKPQNWEYYGLTHGQHISFYSSHTFDYLAKKYNLKYYFILGLHILTNKDIHAFQFEITSFGAVQNMKKSKTFEDSRRMARAKSKKEQSEH